MSHFIVPALINAVYQVSKHVGNATMSPALDYLSSPWVSKRKTHCLVANLVEIDIDGFHVCDTETSLYILHIKGPCGPWSIVTKIDKASHPDTFVYISHFFARGHLTTTEEVEQCNPVLPTDKWIFDPDACLPAGKHINTSYSTHTKTKDDQSDVMCFQVNDHPFSLILNRTNQTATLGVIHGDHRPDVGNIQHLPALLTTVPPTHYDGWWYLPQTRRL
jgi:hypothetical protein